MATIAENNILNTVDSFIAFWSSYANQIVLIWFLIICARCVQLLVGLQSVYYLKRTQIYPAGNFWENKVTELCLKLGIHKKINIFQSGIAKVPMIAGYLKPVILIPLGMLNGISTAEVEAIVSHELAHLKRNDYLVNLIQSLVEIVFFFNPAVLWISRLIREERENCCDDLALSCSESKHQYIRALITCQEFPAANSTYAMALTGKKNHLKERVSRIVFNNNSTLNKMEKTLLTISLIAALTVTAAFSKFNNQKALNGLSHSNALKVHASKAQPSTVIGETEVQPDKPATSVNIIKPQDTSKKALRTQSTVRQKVRVNKTVTRSSRSNRNLNKDLPTPPQPPLAPRAPRAPGAPTGPNPPIAPGKPLPPLPPLRDSQLDDMTTALMKEGLLKDTKNFSYKLNAEGLSIDGEKQPASIHKRYMKKYLKNPEATITTTVSSN